MIWTQLSVLNPDQGGSKWKSVSTLGSCSHHRFRGEGALHDPHVLRVARVPSSPQISYLITITTIHSRTRTQKENPRSVPQISWADASGWCDAAGEPRTSYSQAPSTSVLCYGRHFTLSKARCYITGIFALLVESRFDHGCVTWEKALNHIWEDSVPLCVCVWACDWCVCNCLGCQTFSPNVLSAVSASSRPVAVGPQPSKIKPFREEETELIR